MTEELGDDYARGGGSSGGEDGRGPFIATFGIEPEHGHSGDHETDLIGGKPGVAADTSAAICPRQRCTATPASQRCGAFFSTAAGGWQCGHVGPDSAS
jgi:hypothetical protein